MSHNLIAKKAELELHRLTTELTRRQDQSRLLREVAVVIISELQGLGFSFVCVRTSGAYCILACVLTDCSEMFVIDFTYNNQRLEGRVRGAALKHDVTFTATNMMRTFSDIRNEEVARIVKKATECGAESLQRLLDDSRLLDDPWSVVSGERVDAIRAQLNITQLVVSPAPPRIEPQPTVSSGP